MSEVEEIKSRLDIVDLISEHVNLIQSGRNFKANCPFHSERTPSFIVDPSRQLWRCFGSCSTGGDVFSFLMKVEGIEFPEALRILGERTGIKITGNSSSILKDDYYQINEIAKNFYKSNLNSDEGKIAVDYLQSRGIDLKKIDSFDLGYSFKDRDSLKNHLSFHHVDFEKAIESGLLNKFDNGNVKDFFVGRLMFPISDRNGRVVGFGARSLDDSMPKYINTPSSPVFDKRNILYGLHLAKDSIRKNNEVVVVEGYMDVVAAHEYSFKNVVASMGTALTVEQVRQIRNLASSYILALDQDTAGQEATLRSLQSSWGIFESLNTSKNDNFSDYSKILKVLSIPNGKDPDEFIRSESQDWGKIVSDALPLMDYLIPSLISRFDVNVPGNSQKILELIFPILNNMDQIDRGKYLVELASKFKSSFENVEAMLKVISQSNQRKGYENQRSAPKSSRMMYLLALIFSSEPLKEKSKELNFEIFDLESSYLLKQYFKFDNLIDFENSLSEDYTKFYNEIIETQLLETTQDSFNQSYEFCVKTLNRERYKIAAATFSESQGLDFPTEDQINQINEINAKIRDT